MEFSFTEDQLALREQLSRILGEDIGTTEARAVLDGSAAYSQRTWRALADMGVLGIGFDEEVGGLGLGPMFTCVTMQELGRVNAAVPYVSSLIIVAEAISRAGDSQQRDTLLPALLTGDRIATWAVAEGRLPEQGTDLTVRHGSNGVNGIKTPVVDAGIADEFLVLASDDAGETKLGLVSAKDPGVSIEPLNSIDPSRPISRVTFSNATFEPLDGDGFRVWSDVLNSAAIFCAWEQIGGAEAILEMARNYVMERQAFGRSVASYQAVKHRLADMFVKIAMARANALYAAKTMEAGQGDLTIAAATARISASEAFSYCAREGLHLHGGLGVTWEGDPNLYYRRARFCDLQFETRRWTGSLVDALAAQRKKELADVAI
ncbi:acyl-CoA dehydrogenase family protein [Ruegeria sp.]|uniref:acyl-CoA dehydrogenase family protein n=1 Tax=Ruegeria sp. TaxID=1879320 RepID=UPI003C7ACFC3